MVALLVALGMAAGVSGAAYGGYAGADGAISYSPYASSSPGIYTIEGGRRSLVVKADAGTGVSGGTWSPDGHLLAFVKQTYPDHEGGAGRSDLQVLDVRTGQGHTVVAFPAGRPTWSPDGTKLAYACDRGICVVDLSGRLLWKAPTISAVFSAVQWSPNGQLGYLATTGQTQRVWVANADGSNAKPVTPDENLAWAFTWSPDGSRIAYVDSTKRLFVGTSDGRDWQLVDPGAFGGMSWSPNGKALVYNGWLDDNNHPAGSGLVTINVDGSDRRVLVDPATGSSINAYDADWQRLPALPSNTAEPTVGGTARVTQTLTATAGTWDGDQPLAYEYQWQRCSPSCVRLAATAPTYTVTKADAGSRLRVLVTAKNVAGTSSSTSAETALVPEPSFASLHGRRAGTAMRFTFTVCDQSPADVTVSETDWTVVHGHRRDIRRHSWLAGAGPGCHTMSKAWSVAARGSRTLVVDARDGDGVSTKSFRLTLR